MTQNEFMKIWISLLKKAHAFSKNLECERAKEDWQGDHAQNMAIYIYDKVYGYNADKTLLQELGKSFKRNDNPCESCSTDPCKCNNEGGTILDALDVLGDRITDAFDNKIFDERWLDRAKKIVREVLKDE